MWVLRAGVGRAPRICMIGDGALWAGQGLGPEDANAARAAFSCLRSPPPRRPGETSEGGPTTSNTLIIWSVFNLGVRTGRRAGIVPESCPLIFWGLGPGPSAHPIPVASEGGSPPVALFYLMHSFPNLRPRLARWPGPPPPETHQEAQGPSSIECPWSSLGSSSEREQRVASSLPPPTALVSQSIEGP